MPLRKSFEIFLELIDYEIPARTIVLENLKTSGLKYGAQLREEMEQYKAIEVYKRILQAKPPGKEWALCELAMTCLELQNQAEASYRLMEAIYINPKLMSLAKFEPYRDLASLREEMISKGL